MTKTPSNSQATSHQPESNEPASIETISGLAAGVSHEINMPLGVNIGNSTLLIELLNGVSDKNNTGLLDAQAVTYLSVFTQILTALTSNTLIHGLGIAEDILPKSLILILLPAEGRGMPD